MRNSLKNEKTEERDNLLAYAEAEGIPVFYGHLPHTQAMSLCTDEGCYIAIDPAQIKSIADGNVKIAHELGHCQTGSFYNRYSPEDLKAKHEYRADKWAVHKLIPLQQYAAAISSGYTEVWQLAEYFNVPEAFIRRVDYIYKCEGAL